ncbi:GNAT family N-acetyltransferase [Gaetbulibacter sp. M240]|uniref:GNAT family N-acetyltransferase n=1 Tax=Gaetbulibacter sp. M240 TaxID=3126511 RepID=UPI00374EBDCE
MKKFSSDITFIGSGISTSFSILNFLDLLESESQMRDKITVTVIERHTEFNTGIPYGKRSGFSTLLITSLRNFLIEPELTLFIDWLNKNKSWLLEELRNEGGLLSEKWLIDNEDAITQNDWKDLFIPRRFFGCYIDERVKNKIEALSQKNLVNVEFIQGEVVDVDKVSEVYYHIKLKCGDTITTRKAVLSVGSLPVNYLWKNKSIVEDDNLMVLNNPYSPNLRSSLKKAKSFIKNRSKDNYTNVLIVGANASALEMLYKLNDIKKEGAFKNTSFTFLSTHGRLPDALVDEERQKLFVPKHLKALKSKKNLTAELIAEATYKDLDVAEEIQLGPASTVEIISKHFGLLLEELNQKELEIFACKYGNDIGRRQRCAGLHYSNVVSELRSQDRFEHIAGRFLDLKPDTSKDYKLVYKDTETEKERVSKMPFHLIINCVGSKNLTQEDIPELHKNLISKRFCTPNPSNIGFYVNEKLESSPGFHIMGPMLAGNVIENRAVWHVEHCGRIIGLSKVLSGILFEDLVETPKIELSNYEFEAHTLDTSPKIEIYSKILRTKWDNNIYYCVDNLKYYENLTNILYYFSLKIHGRTKVLMPIYLRQVMSNGKPTKYYDAITPYGYGGPLMDEDISERDMKVFWKSVDQWYKTNHVVSEFIRFSLNQNYTGYSGLLINTLSNVKGRLQSDFELQWDTFLPKVRNNYRKAVSYNLDFKLFNEETLDENCIKQFYEIYINTMIRNKAKSIYFFSLEYFNNLILNNKNNLNIALVYKDNIPISTELIINNNNTIYAYLGGTDSNYYKYRPNDFLRVEVIKWAIKNKLTSYVLGGGLKDGDSLYKSKKSFFPKDDEVIYYTGRKIVDQKVYEVLCENEVGTYSDIHKDDMRNYYFPLYRFNNR